MIEDAPPDLFDDIVQFPNPKAHTRLNNLVGLDDYQNQLVAEASILLDRTILSSWSEAVYGAQIRLLESFENRHPLFLFEGDVGTGKTALAETIGDRIARELKLSVTLYKLSLTARGAGAVGEMTKLITSAFHELRNVSAPTAEGKSGKPTILLIDEADALAQSREAAQMHHEDRAGVNALIRGIDNLTAEGSSTVVILVTNRIDAIDPAIRRRSAQIFRFERPTVIQRKYIFVDYLDGLELADKQIDKLVELTGPTESRSYGCTFSDLVQRLLPEVLLDAMPNQRITFERLEFLASNFDPTPPFNSQK